VAWGLLWCASMPIPTRIPILLALTAGLAACTDVDPGGADANVDPLPPEVTAVLDLPATPYPYAAVELPAHFRTPMVAGMDNTPADNPITDAGATLGRVLFYDVALSANRTISCASCHAQTHAFADPAKLSVGFAGGHTSRNAMAVTDARFYRPGRGFFWDERAATLEDQVLMPIQNATEMGLTLDELVTRVGAAAYYPPLFERAFGDRTISADRIAKALAQFSRTLVSYRSRYDVAVAATGDVRMPLPGFTPEEELGKQVFFDRDRGACAGCHLFNGPPQPGPLGNQAIFFIDIPTNNGLDATTAVDDNGVGGQTAIARDLGRFKSPSLRNVALTAPYMHDVWLEDVQGDRALAWVRERNAEARARLRGRSPGLQRGAYANPRGAGRARPHPAGRAPRQPLQLLAGRRQSARPVAAHHLAEFKQAAAGSGRRCSTSTHWAAGRGRELGVARRRLPVPEVRALPGAACRAAAPTPTWSASSTRSKKEFVAGGFVLPEAKNSTWPGRTSDTIYVGTDFGPGSLTDSGYPRIAKEWRRGTPLAERGHGVRGLAVRRRGRVPRVGPRQGCATGSTARRLLHQRASTCAMATAATAQIAKPDDAQPQRLARPGAAHLRSDWTTAAPGRPARCWPPRWPTSSPASATSRAVRRRGPRSLDLAYAALPRPLLVTETAATRRCCTATAASRSR
jgi:cytochrome c peroxidase